MKLIRPMNRFNSCAISLTLVAFVTTPSRAQDPKPNRITIHRYIDFIAAVEELSRLANVPIQVDPALLKAGSKDQLQMPGIAALNETDAPFEKALQDLLDTANTPLRFRLVRGVYRVERDPTRPYRPIVSVISFALSQPLERALQTLLRAANADPTIGYRMDPSLALAGVDLSQRVRLQQENSPFETALQTLLARATPPLTFTTALSNGKWAYVIKVDPTRKATPPAPKPPPPADAIFSVV
jgi:hypothetical protein